MKAFSKSALHVLIRVSIDAHGFLFLYIQQIPKQIMSSIQNVNCAYIQLKNMNDSLANTQRSHLPITSSKETLMLPLTTMYTRMLKPYLDVCDCMDLTIYH